MDGGIGGDVSARTPQTLLGAQKGERGDRTDTGRIGALDEDQRQLLREALDAVAVAQTG